MSSHSDDLSTDVSSSLSSPFGNSFNRKKTATASSQVERLDEADKQILEWAGKLEMESVDLREKSSQLVQVLKNNSEELCGLVKRLNGALTKQGDLEEVRKSIEEVGSRLEKQVGVLEGRTKATRTFDYESEFKKLEKRIAKSLDEKQKCITRSIEQTQELLFNVSRQMEDTHQVMTSMSKDITTLNGKHTLLEQRILNYKPEARSSSVGLPTLETDDEPTLLNEGPVTRSMSKRTKSAAPRPKKVVKPRDTTVARTIIPWEEVDMYYASEI